MNPILLAYFTVLTNRYYINTVKPQNQVIYRLACSLGILLVTQLVMKLTIFNYHLNLANFMNNWLLLLVIITGQLLIDHLFPQLTQTIRKYSNNHQSLALSEICFHLLILGLIIFISWVFILLNPTDGWQLRWRPTALINQLISGGIIWLLLTKFSDRFIDYFLRGTGTSFATTSDSSPHLGGYIGNLERLIILVFFLINSIPSISIVVAIKAVTRFKALETNEHDFAEYYLIGSMLSLLLGCTFSLLARWTFA